MVGLIFIIIIIVISFAMMAGMRLLSGKIRL